MSDDAAAKSEKSAGPEDGETEGGPAVVLLDPCVEPELLRSIEAELGRSIRIVEPLPLDPDLPGPGDLAIVVPLDLGAVSGIDLVESLRARAESDAVPIAVTSAEPTRRRVRAALRAGATTWLRQPYEAEDWKRRLGPILDAAAEAEASAPDATEADAEDVATEAEEASA